MKILFLVIAFMLLIPPAEAKYKLVCQYGSTMIDGLCRKNKRDPYRCEYESERSNADGSCSPLSYDEFVERQARLDSMDPEASDRIKQLDGEEEIERSIDQKNWEMQKQSMHCDDPGVVCIKPPFQRIGGYRNPYLDGNGRSFEGDPACASPGDC
jgi:hypothetical protein